MHIGSDARNVRGRLRDDPSGRGPGRSPLQSRHGGIRYRLSLPVPEALQEFLGHLRRDRLVTELPEQTDGRPHLPEVAPAVPAHAEVEMEAQAVPEGQLPLQVVGDELRELLAGQHRHLPDAEMLLERPPQPRPAAVQEHSLIGLADVERVTYLFGGQLLEVAQGNHRALVRW